MQFTLTLFWTKYNAFNNKNGPFDSDKFIWKIKEISDGNSHLWHQKYSLPCTKVLRFVSRRVTSKFLGICSDEHSWSNVKTIKSGKRYAIRSYASDRLIIIYTSACI